MPLLLTPFGECLFSSKYNARYSQILSVFYQHRHSKKTVVCSREEKKPAASLKRRKWGLGTPIHIKMIYQWYASSIQFIAIPIGYYTCTLLVLTRSIILPLLLSLLGRRRRRRRRPLDGCFHPQGPALASLSCPLRMETSIQWLPPPRQPHRWWRRTRKLRGDQKQGPKKKQ